MRSPNGSPRPDAAEAGAGRQVNRDRWDRRRSRRRVCSKSSGHDRAQPARRRQPMGRVRHLRRIEDRRQERRNSVSANAASALCRRSRVSSALGAQARACCRARGCRCSIRRHGRCIRTCRRHSGFMAVQSVPVRTTTERKARRASLHCAPRVGARRFRRVRVPPLGCGNRRETAADCCRCRRSSAGCDSWPPGKATQEPLDAVCGFR